MFRMICTNSRNLLKQCSVIDRTRSAAAAVVTASIHTTQITHKNQKSKRGKAPHEAKETQKWVRDGGEKVKRFSEEKVFPAEFVAKKVVDDVWFTKYYMEQEFTLEQAITMHQEISGPDMLNNRDEMIYLNMRLDMKTKKKTKFLRTIRSSVLFPHEFDDGIEKKLLAFCKTDEETQIAKEKGALFAGGSDIIRQLDAGEIDKSEFDFVVATMDIVTDLVPIRHVIKDIFPNKQKGTLGADIGQLVDSVIKSHHYESKRDEFEDESMLTVPIGKLSMSCEELVENGKAIIAKVRTHKPANLGHMIKEIYALIPFSKEQFLLNKQLYRPGEQKLEQESEDNENDSDDEEAVASKS
ncbi:large ribosomal subunit protein uL1-like [Tubulanus polymorphus]|uniref:large ribosomal subunit protein uL1-like n=1 Tax=Tubulanus polymorphus TaxID=672921 RepID=UPI003DA40F5F